METDDTQPDGPELDRRTKLSFAADAATARVGTELAGSDAVALLRQIRKHEISCVEVMTAHLDRITAVNLEVNAIVALQDRGALAPLADGSVYVGSLRNPAGWNNVYGFGTSVGRVPVHGKDDWPPSMGVSGPMARNVADLALLLFGSGRL